MKVAWTQSAIAELTSIYEFISVDSPRYAIAVIDRLTDRTKQIAEFPLSGQAVPEYEREDIEYSYRIIYLTQLDVVYILAVIHGARQLPSSPEELSY